jgi:hypothetical protein
MTSPEYTFKFVNSGDGPATNVKLSPVVLVPVSAIELRLKPVSFVPVGPHGAPVDYTIAAKGPLVKNSLIAQLSVANVQTFTIEFSNFDGTSR